MGTRYLMMSSIAKSTVNRTDWHRIEMIMSLFGEQGSPSKCSYSEEMNYESKQPRTVKSFAKNSHLE